jgi:hypothetical protein
VSHGRSEAENGPEEQEEANTLHTAYDRLRRRHDELIELSKAAQKEEQQQHLKRGISVTREDLREGRGPPGHDSAIRRRWTRCGSEL